MEAIRTKNGRSGLAGLLKRHQVTVKTKSEFLPDFCA